MKARGWKRLGAGLAAAILVVTGLLIWRNHVEEAEKAVLVAEIEADRAARKWPVEPVPTQAELDTADMYGKAVLKIKPDLFDGPFFDDMDSVSWPAVPEAVNAAVTGNAEVLALVDAASARGACRFADTSFQARGKGSKLILLLSARGRVALTVGDFPGATAEVRRLLRVGRDLAAAPSPGGAEEGWPWPDIYIIRAEEAACGLLSALASAPGLPPEAGPALAAAARDPWASPEAVRRSIDAFEDSSDAIDLNMLGPHSETWLAKKNSQIAEIQDLLSGKYPTGNKSLLDKIEDRVRGALRPGIRVPMAASVREYRNARKPIVAAERRRDIGALAPDSPLDKASKSPGVLSPGWFRHSVSNEARIAVARTAAAIRAFQLREGRPPRTLEDLIPSVSPEVPLDPFDGKPLLYEVEGEAWRVASRFWSGSRKEPDGSVVEVEPVEVHFPRPGNK